MDDLLTKLGIGGGSGFLGIVLGWIGFKGRIDNLQTDMKTLKENVRYEDTCVEVHKAVDARLESMEAMQKEMRDDIKRLLAR